MRRQEADSGKPGWDWRGDLWPGGRRRSRHDPGWQAQCTAGGVLSEEPMEEKDRSQGNHLGFPVETKGTVFPGAQAEERS